MIYPTSHKAQRGFTLIELMVVITIIVILGAISVGGIGFINAKQAQNKAQVDIEMLSNAMEKYKLDMGQYPGLDENTDPEGEVTDELYDALFYEGYVYSEDPDSWTEGEATVIYVSELDPRGTKQTLVTRTLDSTPSPSLEIRDPWDRPYRYRKGDNAENPDFDLWSTGKDGQTDVTDPSREIEINRDDIRNF